MIRNGFSYRTMEDRQQALAPVEPMQVRPRDPWLKAMLICALVVIAYFAWQFVR